MRVTLIINWNNALYLLFSIFSPQVLIHHPEEFSQVRDRGFVLGPGTEVFVGVDGSTVYSTAGARAVSSIKRKCYFHDEKLLGYYTNYTRSNCLMECAFKYTKEICGCVPYFYPSKKYCM